MSHRCFGYVVVPARNQTLNSPTLSILSGRAYDTCCRAINHVYEKGADAVFADGAGRDRSGGGSRGGIHRERRGFGGAAPAVVQVYKVTGTGKAPDNPGGGDSGGGGTGGGDTGGGDSGNGSLGNLFGSS